LTNYLLLAMSCSVSKEPLHPVATTKTLHHKVMENNQPTNKPNSTVTQNVPFISITWNISYLTPNKKMFQIMKDFSGGTWYCIHMHKLFITFLLMIYQGN
jgi:hypothetical protein